MADLATTSKTNFYKSDKLPGLDITPRQLKAIEALIAGKGLTGAAKAAGTIRQQVARWLADDDSFAAEYKRQGLALRKSFIDKVFTGGNVASDSLTKMASGKHQGRKLAASKALLTAAATLAKSTVEAQDGMRIAPLFVLPANTSISLEVDIPDVPDTRAPVIVDAELAKALPDPIT